MKIGVAAPVSGAWATAANLAHLARRAEEFGYHSLWTFQRLLSPVDGSWGAAHRSVLDPIVTMAHLAAHTDAIRIGVAVLGIPLFTPAVLAKQVATLDVLSGGRIDVGLGIGRSDAEHTAAGVAQQGMGRRSDEFIAALKNLWTEETPEHEGEFFRIPRCRMEPKPVQAPHPPILLGGSSPRALRRAGRSCDGWIGSSKADFATIRASVAAVRDAAADPGRLRFACRVAVRVRARDENEPFTGTPAKIREDLSELAGTGLTEAFLDPNFDPEIGSPDVDAETAVRRTEAAWEELADRSGTC
ncbi:TIGR03619 family F420-dependent LLM class oxidoreductase [Kutzneria buriramensis]|uniref:Putative F420-dependent oxidoreductase n=1 Tax=Kutzneria buriramensis TaxID=1045776 RepID=A0A3E0G8E0_9PSEU|nr:TIGR03619 family F420-dependent LLM class oxidoreductase [Kutzneria buriramensis]REH18154.1 putative F420-dependent oxidoreductase [Kutzneria buriramensis]